MKAEVIKYIFDGVCAILGLTGIGTFLYWKTNHRKEAASATKQEAEAQSSVIDNWQEFVEEQKKSIKQLNEKVAELEAARMKDKEEFEHKLSEMRDELNRKERRIAELERQNKVKEICYCDNMACEKRNPPLGQYSSSKEN